MTTRIAAEALSGRLESSLDEMKHIEDQWGSDRASWPTGQAERYDRKSTEVARLNAELEDVTRSDAIRAEKTAAIRETIARGEATFEAGFFAPGQDMGVRRRTDPWSAGEGDDLERLDSRDGLSTRAHDAVEYARGLTPSGRELLSTMLDKDTTSRSAAFVIAATSDAYRSAFEKILADSQRGHLLFTDAEREAYARVEYSRAAMSTTGANGGFLLPFSLDPSVILTNAGATNPMRQYARIESTFSNTWNGASSAGVTGQWLAENVAATDASPTFARVTVTPQKGVAYVMASYELAGDTNIVRQIPQLIADSRSRMEAAAFFNGNGTTEPEGLVAAVGANAPSRVAPSVAATISGQVDIYKVWDALTPRARVSKSMVFAANNAIISKIRQFDTAGGSAFIASLGDGQPPTLLGAPLLEASTMTGTIAASADVLIGGDASEFIIVDRIGTTVVDVPAVVDTNGMPTGTRGWFAYYRVGSKVADLAAFRLLRL